jgi:hypothetical protein
VLSQYISCDACEEDDILHEHLAPMTLFSTGAFSQLQFMAACLPHEQVASAAQAQPPELRPQQVDGRVVVGADIVLVLGEIVIGLKWAVFG